MTPQNKARSWHSGFQHDGAVAQGIVGYSKCLEKQGHFYGEAFAMLLKLYTPYLIYTKYIWLCVGKSGVTFISGNINEYNFCKCFLIVDVYHIYLRW